MTKNTRAYRTVSAHEIFAQFSPERRKKINARAAKLIENERWKSAANPRLDQEGA